MEEKQPSTPSTVVRFAKFFLQLKPLNLLLQTSQVCTWVSGCPTWGSLPPPPLPCVHNIACNCALPIKLCSACHTMSHLTGGASFSKRYLVFVFLFFPHGVITFVHHIERRQPAPTATYARTRQTSRTTKHGLTLAITIWQASICAVQSVKKGEN